ncbi:PRC and DUF2382 domain-containing protein [Nocardioides sp.]|uniref:PRC and DUF2382 domain-containing protein n=1 Tax=Nocardioides sp. TaxID=35761 RepID=UPI002B8D0F77|nr:PRC and DUF2382 domain-containing protein [Nocardioides sp.]HXH81025.1 PRC and DUF2382 domain-containing protein [Nocardioides sp.]
MISTDQTQQLLTGGGNVVDNDGSKIGSIGQVYLDDQTGQPEWVTVKTGMFGGGESFVPLREAEVTGDDLRVPYSKDKVKDAPRIEDADSHLSETEEAELYRYYGVGGADYDTSNDTSAVASHGDTGHDTSGPDTDSAMTRSEEQLEVGTEKREAGRARLRKYVVTENVTTTVPVSHEEVRLEREPITDDNIDQATSGGDITSEEHDVVLTEERVVVNKETVPVERVRVDKETVTEHQEVSEEVRKEQIELDENAGTTGDQDSDDRRV